MQITDPKSHCFHNHRLKINCTDQIILLFEYLPIQGSLTSGIDKWFQSLHIKHSLQTEGSKEELTGFKGISFLFFLHMFTPTIGYGAREDQRVIRAFFNAHAFLNRELLLYCRL